MGNTGGVAQLGEHLLCKQRVMGSSPFTSTLFFGQEWFSKSSRLSVATRWRKSSGVKGVGEAVKRDENWPSKKQVDRNEKCG